MHIFIFIFGWVLGFFTCGLMTNELTFTKQRLVTLLHVCDNNGDLDNINTWTKSGVAYCRDGAQFNLSKIKELNDETR